MELLYFVLCAFGMTQILVYGTIFDKIRPKKEWFRGFGQLFHCTMCMGAHVGWFLCLLSPFTSLWNFDVSLVNCFILMCLSSGTSYILCSIINDEGISLQLRK